MKTIRRRRLERKTDYKARLALLKSEEKRLIARKTNRYIIAQIVKSIKAQDSVIIMMTSKILLSHGWPKEYKGSLKSLQAAYLTGYIIGKIALEKKIKEAILDMGMHKNVHKSRIYAVLKGAIDAGLKIPHNQEALSLDSDFQKNEKLKNFITKIKQNL